MVTTTKSFVKIWPSVVNLGPLNIRLQISYFCLIFQALDLIAFVLRNSKIVNCLHRSGLFINNFGPFQHQKSKVNGVNTHFYDSSGIRNLHILLQLPGLYIIHFYRVSYKVTKRCFCYFAFKSDVTSSQSCANVWPFQRAQRRLIFSILIYRSMLKWRVCIIARHGRHCLQSLKIYVVIYLEIMCN